MTAPDQVVLDQDSSDSKLLNSLQSKTDYLNIKSNLNNYYTLNYVKINIDSNRIILNGETQIRFLGNIRVWQSAATFLLLSIILSEFKLNYFFLILNFYFFSKHENLAKLILLRNHLNLIYEILFYSQFFLFFLHFPH